jgi:hypothetical protein
MAHNFVKWWTFMELETFKICYKEKRNWDSMGEFSIYEEWDKKPDQTQLKQRKFAYNFLYFYNTVCIDNFMVYRRFNIDLDPISEWWYRVDVSYVFDVSDLVNVNSGAYICAVLLHKNVIYVYFIIIIWFVRLLALRPLLAYCASLGW